jgi:uncharacterized protein YciI
MKFNGPYAAVALTLILASSLGAAQTPEKPMNTPYDAALARRLGADDLGMRTYVMCFLKTGPLKVDDPQKRAELMKGHFGMIERLAKEKKLLLAGPFADGGELRGIYVFDVGSIEEAKMLTESDPSIQQGFFKVEFVKWYGSAALREVNDIHRRIAKRAPQP